MSKPRILSRFDKKMIRQDGKCFYCRVDIYPANNMLDKPQRSMATFDHLFPKGHPLANRKTSGQERDKAVLACFGCNKDRGSAPWEEFYKLKVNG